MQNIPFDLVLMDLRMPQMDGREATLAIRRLPGSKSNVVIVALTANAIKEELESCLQAGMNAYVTKPIDRRVLLSEIRRQLISSDGAAKRTERSSQEANENVLIDFELLEHLQADTSADAVYNMLKIFDGETAKRLQAIEHHLRNADIDSIGVEAHAIKGSAGNFGAVRLQKLASEVEHACRSGNRKFDNRVSELIYVGRRSLEELEQYRLRLSTAMKDLSAPVNDRSIRS